MTAMSHDQEWAKAADEALARRARQNTPWPPAPPPVEKPKQEEDVPHDANG